MNTTIPSPSSPENISQYPTQQPSAPSLSTTPIPQPSDHDDATETIDSEKNSDREVSDESSSNIKEKKLKNEYSSFTCLPWRPFKPHDIHEASQSTWFDIRIILIFRVLLTSALLGHLVFFSLRNDFSYRRYETWNFVGLTLSLFLSLICSLLDLIRDEDDDQNDQFAQIEGDGMITDPERQPVGQLALPEPKILKFLTRITVPLYQTFISATLFGATLYWSLLFDSNSVSISYPFIMLFIAAPAAALADFILSMSMHFRVAYIAIYTLYNIIYFGFLWAFFKLKDDVIYENLDPSKSSFTSRIAAVAGGSILAAFLIYFISLLKDISCLKRKKSDSVDLVSKDDEDQTESAELSTKIVSETSNDSINKHANISRQNTQRSTQDRAVEVDPDFCVNRNSIDEAEIPSISSRNDRSSVPITPTGSFGGNSGQRWLRSRSGRLLTSLSNQSLGNEEERNFARVDSKSSVWDELNPPTPEILNEYFTMPGAYTATGQEEAIKLESTPMVRTDSNGRISGRMSASNSGRFSRNSSGNGIGRVFAKSSSSSSLLHLPGFSATMGDKIETG